MDEMNYNADILQFDIPIHQSSFIKVIGVGGGGGNAVNHMYRQGIKGVDFIVCNTDSQALDASPVPTKVQLGKGLGAGNVPSVAEEEADKKRVEIKSLLEGNTQMLFITAGMGGGTGTGAAPVIASIAKEIELQDEVKKILTVAIVTTPFSFEGRKRQQQALEGIQKLRQYVDAILIINNDKLREFGDLPIRKAFAKADDILTMAAKGISEIITVSSYVQIDFKDVNTVMSESGVALMGYGRSEGQDRARTAIHEAINSPLLNDSNIQGAKNILLYISSSPEEGKELRMEEIDEITNYIKRETGGESDLIWGAGFDDTLGDELAITLIATGFNEKELFEEFVITKKHTLEDKSQMPANVRKPGSNEGLDNIMLVSDIKRMEAEAAAAAIAEAKAAVEAEALAKAQAEAQAEEMARVEAEEMARVELAEMARVEAEKAVEAEIIAKIEAEMAAEAAIEKEQSELAHIVDDWAKDITAHTHDFTAEMQAVVETEEEKLEREWKEAEMKNAPLIEEEEDFFVMQAGEGGLSSILGGLELMDKQERQVVAESSVMTVEAPISSAPSVVNISPTVLHRAERLRELSDKIKSQKGLEELESTPAYLRQNIKLDHTPHSSENEAPRYVLSMDGTISGNSFFNDNVD